jgi:hypothetical protein
MIPYKDANRDRQKKESRLKVTTLSTPSSVPSHRPPTSSILCRSIKLTTFTQELIPINTNTNVFMFITYQLHILSVMFPVSLVPLTPSFPQGLNLAQRGFTV